MMDEYYNVNDAKESLCYFSTNFQKDIKYARDEETRVGCRIYDREFVLPDYVSTFHGSARMPLRLLMLLDQQQQEQEQEQQQRRKEKEDNNEAIGDIIKAENPSSMNVTSSNDKNDENPNQQSNTDDNENEGDSDDESEEQIRKRIMKQREEERRRREMEEEERQALLLSVERFAIPEILFTPSDIEMKQLGLAQAIVQSIEACDEVYRAAMYHNIILTGGNANIPNLKERLEVELRSMAPIQYSIRIFLPKEPATFAFQGAQDIVTENRFICGIDRAEWEVSKQNETAGNAWSETNQAGDGTKTINITI
jgi:actin-related protein 6